ncbi:unnamed protein product [Lasius platythorax]|uniref:Uncharacterized protein n=1 Tax=Lasius platythorax TaxID=488582 RepID=A0AAV2P5U3_9HYME
MHFLGTPTLLDNVLYGARRGPSIVSRSDLVVGKAGRMENVFISGRAVTGTKEQALKASTKAIKVRPRSPISERAISLTARTFGARCVF